MAVCFKYRLLITKIDTKINSYNVIAFNYNKKILKNHNDGDLQLT